jgi:VanZ family protein
LFWLSYAIFIVYVTTLPFDFVFSTSAALEKLQGVSHHLFTGPDGHRASLSDMVQNVILFAPFGVLCVAALTTRRESRDRAGRLVMAVAVAAITGCALSATVETLQLFTPERVTSLNDVVTDTIGAFLGGLVAVAGVRVRRRLDAQATYAATLHELYPLLVWGAVAVLAAWHPFDTTLDIGGIASKVRSLIRDPWQAGVVADEGVDAVRYALFTASCVICFERLGIARPRVRAALAGVALPALLEFSQFFVQSRMPGLKDVTVGAVASCLTAWLAGPRWWTRRRAGNVAAVASLAASAVMMLSPFVIRSDRHPFTIVPLRSYAAGPPERTISHAAELSLAFFPLGFALALLLPRRGRLIRVAVIAFALGLLLEFFQGWIAGRYPDVTDAAVLALGALAGTWAAGNIAGD